MCTLPVSGRSLQTVTAHCSKYLIIVYVAYKSDERPGWTTNFCQKGSTELRNILTILLPIWYSISKGYINGKFLICVNFVLFESEKFHLKKETLTTWLSVCLFFYLMKIYYHLKKLRTTLRLFIIIIIIKMAF